MKAHHMPMWQGDLPLLRVLGIEMLDWRELDPGRLASYWTARVASGIEDYYAGEGEAPGEWYGQGATALGLRGEIDPDDLIAVLKSEYGELKTMSNRVGPGHSPYSGGTTTVRRRPGWDFCFRAPKSVSLIWAFGDERARLEVLAAHDAAVKAALDYAERHLVKTRRSVGGVRQQVKGEGLIVALFRHRTSRAGDPLLHTHALVVNAIRDDRGRWLRINAPHLLGASKTLSCDIGDMAATLLNARGGMLSRWTIGLALSTYATSALLTAAALRAEAARAKP